VPDREEAQVKQNGVFQSETCPDNGVALIGQPLLAEVIQILQSVIPGSPELAGDTELLRSGLIDSLSLVTAVTRLEARFRVTLPAEALVPETFETPATVHAVVADSVSAAQP
jgi:acyl carrier protein